MSVDATGNTLLRPLDELSRIRLRDLGMAVLTGLVAATFALVFFSPITAALPGPDYLVLGGVVVGVFLLVTAVTYRKRSRPERETAGRSVWDAIPSWQYTGRHVESGGITRDGQERALEEIQEQAGALERDSPDRGE